MKLQEEDELLYHGEYVMHVEAIHIFSLNLIHIISIF